jgi:hypothetical protein
MLYTCTCTALSVRQSSGRPQRGGGGPVVGLPRLQARHEAEGRHSNGLDEGYYNPNPKAVTYRPAHACSSGGAAGLCAGTRSGSTACAVEY